MASFDSDKQGSSSLLTFGVELEFVVAYLEKGETDPHPDDKRNVYIAEGLDDFKPSMNPKMIRVMVNQYRIHPERALPDGLTLEGYRDRLNEGRPRYSHDVDEPNAHIAIRHRIAKFLRTHSIRAISDSNDPETDQVLEDRRGDLQRRLGRADGDMPPLGGAYGFWDVNTDASVDERQTKEYKWAPIEIKSPILYYTKESLELVRYVVNLLQSEFRILLNSSMMLHVHVGRGDRSFSLTELREITALLYAASPRLDQLHPIWCGPLTIWAPGARPHSLMANLDKTALAEAVRRRRRPGRKNPLLRMKTDMEDQKQGGVSHLPDPYYRPLVTRQAHELLQGWLGHQQANAFGVARIMQTETLKELYDCLATVFLDPYESTYYFRSAYNFRNLVDDPVEKKTIEFRQHCATINADAVVNWISVAAGLCGFCVSAPYHEGLSPVMRKLEHLDPNSAKSWEMNEWPPENEVVNTTSLLYGRRGDPYSVYDLLRDVGLAPQAEYYKARGIHPLPPDYFPIRNLGAHYGFTNNADDDADDEGYTEDDENSNEENKNGDKDDGDGDGDGEGEGSSKGSGR